MNCTDMEGLIPLYLDGELAGDDTVRVKEHLSRCPACRKLLEEFELIELALTDRREDMPPPAATIDAVMSRVRLHRYRMIVDRMVSVPVLASVLFLTVTLALIIYRNDVSSLFALDLEAQGVLGGLVQRFVDLLMLSGGTDLWTLAIVLGGVTVAILCMIGLTVRSALGENRV